MIVFNNAGSGTKRKVWAPSEEADKALGLRLGTRLIKLTFSAEKLKKNQF